MAGVDWLTARPVAHRGLHDASAGVIENTAAAFSAAMAAGYGIETDLQISADGEAMVHHDDALGRLTVGSGASRRDERGSDLKPFVSRLEAGASLRWANCATSWRGRATIAAGTEKPF